MVTTKAVIANISVWTFEFESVHLMTHAIIGEPQATLESVISSLITSPSREKALKPGELV